MTKQATMTKQKQINRTREQSPSPEPVYTSKYEQQKYEKKNYEVPSKESYFFDRSNQPMAEICEETNYFQQLPDEIKFRMFRFICEQSHEGPSVYGEYDAPPNRETTDSINGKGGYFLQKTTEAADIYLIWHNHQKNIYKFWGPTERAVRDAMNRIRGRIVKYVVHVNSAEKPTRHIDLAGTPPPAPARDLPPTLMRKPLCVPAEEEEFYPGPIMRSNGCSPYQSKWSDQEEEDVPQTIGLSRSMSIAH